MKVGDLVKLADVDFTHATRDAVDFNRIGLVVECHPTKGSYSGLVSGWVQWENNRDWDIEYANDLEIISEF